MWDASAWAEKAPEGIKIFLELVTAAMAFWAQRMASRADKAATTAHQQSSATSNEVVRLRKTVVKQMTRLSASVQSAVETSSTATVNSTPAVNVYVGESAGATTVYRPAPTAATAETPPANGSPGQS